MTYYTAKPEFIEFVNKIIKDKPQFAEIREYAPNIGFLFIGGTVPKPRMKVATCMRCSKLIRFLTKYDYILMIDDGIWNEISDEKTKEMIVVHELTHIKVKRDKDKEVKTDDVGDIVWDVIDHDIQDFKSILDVYPDAHNMLSQIIQRMVEQAEEDKKSKKKND